jgi:hypothetical protein
VTVRVTVSTDVAPWSPSLDRDDPRRIVVRMFDGREVRVITLEESLSARPDGETTYCVVASGRLTTLVGRDHLTHTGHVAYLPTVDGLCDANGVQLDERLQRHVRGRDALRALAEGTPS